MTVTTDRVSGATAIRPFTIDFPESDLVDMRARIAATRWPDKETVGDHSQGVRLATIQELARYWLNEHDWRTCEAKLNAWPNFITEIDGLDIHFIHVRSPHEDALPLLICHGWPGSVLEQVKIIDPLTNPTADGGSASDAFHVVIPSMPGYGFSGKPTTTGWDPARIASAYVELMKRLGYARFAAQGGDWGAFVIEQMAVLGRPELVGIHTNFAQVVPPVVDKALQTGAPGPSALSAEERRAYDQVAFTFQHLVEQLLMASRPQTLYGLADSPVALAAFFLDHDVTSQEGIARAFLEQVPLGDLSRDDVLDNITLFWLTNTAISSARLSWEAAVSGLSFFGVKGVSLPVAVSVFPDELYQPPRSWADQAYPNLVHFNELPMGGHFAAWGEPKALTEEVRVGLRSLR
jgi:pimeloyl-ACP methyl ester carboxylesterase